MGERRALRDGSDLLEVVARTAAALRLHQGPVPVLVLDNYQQLHRGEAHRVVMTFLYAMPRTARTRCPCSAALPFS